MHGTLVAKSAQGVLLRGPSGAGKSDLALRLLGRGWQLVSDDQVLLSRCGDSVHGTAPRQLAGLLEVRGIGIVTVAHLTSARIWAVVDLGPSDHVERMPSPTKLELIGVPINSFKLYSFEASAPEKLELLLRSVVST